MKKKIILLGILAGMLAYSAHAQSGVRTHQRHHQHEVRKHLNHEQLTKMELRNLKRQQWRLHRHKQRIRADGAITPKERMQMRAHRKAAMRHDTPRQVMPRRRH